ncbi:mechanosensitive ion channel [Tamlana sp. 2_MG-2023]|uniref:mechanosensitive ion channel family protein n=1 Tax=unclassified Tamlana TaxID=2614803 RepID=UPI0026E3CA78|nr:MULTISPECIES: mechanosensitive ion channel domain-containing protein [unclassified Tamlana]MDO6760871.1 mechanosensitive ion channel [Tamlana sp. 2_MG-2023]MDO6791127.1 mechanosensitive ion channel [Tamlana sp. 1_MG-2023]
MNFRHYFSLLFICCIGLINIETLNAQNLTHETKQIEEIDSTKVRPKAILLTNIVREIQITNSNVKAIQRKIKIPESIKKIDSLLPRYAEFLKSEGEATNHFIKANPNGQKVDLTMITWSGYSSYLSGWMDKINDEQERNSILIENIIFQNQEWQLSYQNAIHKEAPPEVLESIENTLVEVQTTKNTILENNNFYLKLETNLSKEINYVKSVTNDLLALKNSEVYDLFYLRHPPIWKTSFGASNKDVAENSEVEALQVKSAENPNVGSDYMSSIISFLIFIGIFTLTMRYFKRGFLKYPYKDKDEDVIVAKNLILKKNNLCIIFLSCLFSELFLTNFPKPLTDSLTLITILAAIPLITPIMSDKYKKILYYVAVFYILNTAKTYFWYSGLGYRLYILAEAALVIFILYRFTSPYLKTLKTFEKGFSKLLFQLVPVVYILATVSIISNILGYTNLTDITLKISTQGTIVTMLFYALALIINGIVVSVIHRHFTVKHTYSAIERKNIEKKALKRVRITVYMLWGIVFLAMIDVLRPLITSLGDFLSEPYKMGSLTFTLGAIVSFSFTLFISFSLTKLVSFLINDGDGILRFLNLPKGIPAAISLVIRYFIIGFGTILALSALGVDLSKFNLMAGALGVGIGFGLQNIVSNFISGLILVFERPILPGDTVEVNNLLGTVSRIGIRASNISTFDGAEVVVPNNNLISNDLINWTLSNSTKRIEILIGTTYDSDPNEILKILVEVAEECDYLLKEPAPRALFNDFGDSSLNFRLLFWVHYELGLQAKSDISIGIYNRFKKEGIEIPFPQRDLNLRNVPESFNLIPPHDTPETPIAPVITSKESDEVENLDKNLKRPVVDPLKTDINSDGSDSDGDGAK